MQILFQGPNILNALPISLTFSTSFNSLAEKLKIFFAKKITDSHTRVQIINVILEFQIYEESCLIKACWFPRTPRLH